jgi:transcriptional regulator with XRE-family HTH domain
VEVRSEVAAFLASRRARITPHQVGLSDSGWRRVPGLRRCEVAQLAGISEDYYSRLERGAIAGVSASVLNAVAEALRLDDGDRQHLFHLAHAADGTSAGMRARHRPSDGWAPQPSLRWVLDSYQGPALVRNGRMDLLACNSLGAAMHAPIYAATGMSIPNFVRFTILEREAAAEFYPDWDQAADTCVAILRAESGRDPHDRALQDLVSDLCRCSPQFVRWWGKHGVRYHGAGIKTFHHPKVGDLELAYESVDMISEPGLTLTLFAPAPGSRTARALDDLARLPITPA